MTDMFYNANGMLVTAKGTQVTQRLEDWVSGDIDIVTDFGAGIQFSGARVFTGVAQDVAQSYIFSQALGITGDALAANDGIISPFHISISTDTADSGSNAIEGISVRFAASAGHKGRRHAALFWQLCNGAPDETVSGNIAYVGQMSVASSGVNVGGASGFDNALGSLFGGNSNAFFGASSTFWRLINAHEFNVTVPTGASVSEKHGMTIIKAAADAVRGTYSDSAISINDQDSTTATWAIGLEFGAYSHKWSFGVDSTLIGATARVEETPETPVALYGVDFSAVTFQSGGASFKSTGFAVTPTGAILTIDGASGPIVRPSYIADRYYAPLPGSSGAAAIPAADIIYFLPFEISSPITITGSDVRVTTGGAGSSIKVAIWADSAVSHRPLGAPLIVDNTGVATASSSTDVTPALTGTLQPGRYWYGVKTTGTPPACNAYTVSHWMDWLIGTKSDASNPVGSPTISIAAAYASDMPTLAEGATFGAVAVAVPVLLLKT